MKKKKKDNRPLYILYVGIDRIRYWPSDSVGDIGQIY